MNPFFAIIHLVSVFWLWNAWKQWSRYLLSNSLFVVFVSFILLANLAPYFVSQLDMIAQLFGIDLAVRAASYFSIIALFVIIKHLYRNLREQERTLAKLARAMAVQEFRAKYLRAKESAAE